MASYSVNPEGVAWAEQLIDRGQYVLSSDWGQVQPRACQYRAAEWRHKDIELAAHDLLQRLDRRSS